MDPVKFNLIKDAVGYGDNGALIPRAPMTTVGNVWLEEPSRKSLNLINS